MSSDICHPSSDREAVLITGAAKRVGREIALHLARAGYDIALHYQHSAAEADATRQEIQALGRACVSVQADLANLSALPRLIEQAAEALPNLAHLVNNAAIFEQGTLMESDADLLQRHMRINFEAPALLTQAFVKWSERSTEFRVQKEASLNSELRTPFTVTNILDSKITRNRHGYFFYLLSKKALADFTKMAAVELAPRVRVNGVAPGIVLPSSDGVWGEEYMKQEAQRLPLQKTALPADVARAVHFFITTPSLTGQILFADGGGGLG